MKSDISSILDAHFTIDPDTPHDPADGLPLAVPSFGRAEVAEAMEALLTGWLTMGRRVSQFESLWSAQVGCTHGVAVNSGSSALLVMLSGMIESGHLSRGQEVLVPAVGWSTSLFSVAQAGLVPVLVDVDLDTLSLRGAFSRPVLAIHMLGYPADVSAPLVLEDACGAHGARLRGVPAGSLGHAAAWSFFFSHHITTGEGGMVTTSDPQLADVMRSVRAHGWVRDRSDRDALVAAHPDIDPRFLFVTPGLNVRMTDLAASFGIHQVPRLPGFVAQRRANLRSWCAQIDALDLPVRVFPEPPDTECAAFAFPILLREDAPLSRAELCARLEARGISTRPISGGNLARQPAAARVPGLRVEGPLPVADMIHDRGFFVGQSHAFGEGHGALLAGALRDAFK
jgi:CDP-6-deoxy-D-xylo-4-hexulose-3-dehydrase